MRRTQELTRQIERGVHTAEERFEGRRVAFLDKFKRWAGVAVYGFRITLQPLTKIYLEKVGTNKNFQPVNQEFPARLSGGKSILIDSMAINTKSKPIIRGVRNEVRIEIGLEIIMFDREMMNDGLIEYQILRTGGSPAGVYELVVPVINLLWTADNFRIAAGAPNTEFEMDIQIAVLNKNLPISPSDPDEAFTQITELPVGSVFLPRMIIGPNEEFERVVEIVQEDFWGACGIRAYNCLSHNRVDKYILLYLETVAVLRVVFDRRDGARS